jgi:polyhydroxyalkanoate synthase
MAMSEGVAQPAVTAPAARERGVPRARPEGEPAGAPRRGPRPLALYLAVARDLARRRGSAQPLAMFIDGVKAYWRHPGRRRMPEPRALWRAGSARLLDFGPPGGVPLLLVPSLVNRAYVLDLLPGRSLARHLAATGIRPLLLDWGAPSGEELGFDLDAYILRRLEPALGACRAATGRRPVLLGYCMGGLLATAVATRRRPEIAGLALLATPWDFAAARPLQPLPPPVATRGLAATLIGCGRVPQLAIDLAFASLDPAQVVEKFIAFGRLPPDSPRARRFVAIEDWLADGVPLAGPLARQCLVEWYIENRPARGLWRVDGRAVRPERLDLPVLVAVPSRDRIVPEASALALARALPQAELVRPRSGHVGMVAGGRAPELLWRPLADWLRRIALPQQCA